MEELTPGQIRYRKYKRSYLKYQEKNRKMIKDKSLFGGNRESAIKRDGQKCVMCGITREEHKIKYNFDITVDHINGKGKNTPKSEKDNRLENLQTLCLSCHGKKDKESIATPICQYDLKGNLLAKFPSYMEASRQLNLDESGIAKVIIGKYHTLGGFIFRKENL